MEAISFFSGLLTSTFAAFLAAWLAARFALRRYYSEKVWERKVAAYTAIFESLHDMETWFDEHLTAYFRGRDISDEESSKLGESYEKAKADLGRRLSSEAWLIPSECQERLQKMTRDRDRENSSDWFEMLDTRSAIVSQAKRDLIQLMRADLALDHPGPLPEGVIAGLKARWCSWIKGL